MHGDLFVINFHSCSPVFNPQIICLACMLEYKECWNKRYFLSSYGVKVIQYTIRLMHNGTVLALTKPLAFPNNSVITLAAFSLYGVRYFL